MPVTVALGRYGGDGAMLHPRTAVVIEDDRDVGNLVCGFLKMSGLSLVRLADTGVKGVAAVQELSPGIVILDYGLPDISGLEVIRQLRIFSSAPILMLTGRGELADQLLAAGADGVISKPFRMSALRVGVEELLRLWQGEAELVPDSPVPDVR